MWACAAVGFLSVNACVLSIRAEFTAVRPRGHGWVLSGGAVAWYSAAAAQPAPAGTTAWHVTLGPRWRRGHWWPPVETYDSGLGHASVVVALWLPALVGAAGAAGCWWLRRRLPLPGVCPHCGYSLAGLHTGVCPECGGAVGA
jgi:hypothetical protein